MSPEDILNKLQEKFGEKILSVNTEVIEPFAEVKPASITEVCGFLKENPDLDFKSLMCISSIDVDEENVGAVYHLYSISKKHKITLWVTVPKKKPSVPSVSKIWRAADWHEREAFDMMGISFTEHPDLRRILCPEDWEGFPLRKDYQVQEKYHGMTVPHPDDKKEN
ncbi:NADH-quinone oxidoreductase subunit C [candidate division KSB1 bacterium]